jgi:hypothetical protein
MAAASAATIEHSDFQSTLFKTLINNAQIFNSVTELENWFTNNNIAVYKFDPNKEVGNFNKYICSAFSTLLDITFLEITNKLIAQVSGGVQYTYDQLAAAGHFTIEVKFPDTTTKSHKMRKYTVSYSDMLTKFNVFKQAIDKAFDTTDIYITQSDFMKKFFNETLSLLNMNIGEARKLFESIPATEQCEIANNIPWPGTPTPNRFNTQFHWQRYCYICGNPITAAYPAQCEHIIPLMQACAFNCLIQNSTNMTTASAESKQLFKLEYAGAHKCCNLLKNISFITININNNPPITINKKAIYKLLNEIRARATGPDDNGRLGCINVDDFNIHERVDYIITNYLQPIVDLLNAKLQAPTGTSYSSSGLILLYIRINQFLAFQPSIEQTILSILTGSVKTEMIHIKVLTSTPFKIRTKLEKEIIDKLKTQSYTSISSVNSHHLLDIGFEQIYVDEIRKHIIAKADFTDPRGQYASFLSLFNYIKGFLSYPSIKIFQSYDYFFNINHPSNSFNISHFRHVKYPPTAASSPLTKKIKYFFKSLINMFYSEDRQTISKKEEDALSNLCKKYIGMEFTYIISYYLENTGWPDLERLKNTRQTCHDNYAISYIQFVTHFFIYQLLNILYLLDYITPIIDTVNVITLEHLREIMQKQNLVGETFFNLYAFLYTKPDGKTLIDELIGEAIKTLEPIKTELEAGVEELEQITTLVTSCEQNFYDLFIKLLSDPNIDIIVVKNPSPTQDITNLFKSIDSIPLIRGGMLPEKKPEKKSKTDPEKRSKIKEKIAQEEEWQRNQYISGINAEMKRVLLKLSTYADTTYSYYLRQHPTQVLPINLDKNISRLAIDDTRGIYICIYSPAYISSIYICILIDTYFLNKIVEMIEYKYVFSNGELLDDTDIELLQMLIDIDTSKKNGRAIGSARYNELFNNSKFFTQHSNYIPLFEKCNLFLYYDSGDNSVRDIYDNKLYASGGGVIRGGKKYHIKKTKKLKNKKIVKKTKEKLKTKTRKHKPRKHKSRKHKSKLTKTLKKKI